MNISAVLDTAIGLIMMYLVLSLFCTTINEFIANIFRLRASTLKDALSEMIDNPDLKALFYNHGLIDGTTVAATAGNTKPTPAPGPADASPAPPAGPIGKVFTWLYSWWRYPHPSYLSSQDVAMAILDSASFMSTADAAKIPDIQAIKDALPKIGDTNIRDALLAGLAVAGDMSTLRDNMAAWFDSSMDRLSGAYKRNLQIISLAVGLAIAASLNVDTLQVSGALWKDQTLSAAIAQSAAATVSDPLIMQSACTSSDATKDMSCDAAKLKGLDDQLRKFPIGWQNWSLASAWPQDWNWFFLKAFGLLLTTIALSLGAPFWFDLLSQFMNLRGTGDKPATVKQK